MREGQVATLLRSICSLACIGRATVVRLFTMAERVEGPPYCYPSPSLCACQRVHAGNVVFHPTQGYPQEIAMNREIRPNLLHADYWRWSWATRDLGVCRGI
ncbi:MAG: hypothetical protein MUD01_27100, partial [Chloroflexaceae bacterium]|nr:hypothetical protein [Chloroflexaceae bacterium]